MTLAAGQRMWANRFGDVTAIRLPVPAGTSLEDFDARPGNRNLLASLRRRTLVCSFEPVRAQALKAAAQAQDFGQLFLGLQHLPGRGGVAADGVAVSVRTGTAGGRSRHVAGAGVHAQAGAAVVPGGGGDAGAGGRLLGALGGLAYAKAMLWGLATVWRSAVGASTLQFHATPATLIIGVCAGTVVAAADDLADLAQAGATASARTARGGSPKSEVQSPKSGSVDRAGFGLGGGWDCQLGAGSGRERECRRLSSARGLWCW